MSEYEKMKANKVPLILSIVLYEENVHVNKIDHLFIIIHVVSPLAIKYRLPSQYLPAQS